MVPALLALFIASGASPGEEIEVNVRVIEAEFERPVPARIYLWRDNELLLPAGFPAYRREPERHFLVSGDFTLRLSPGKYRIRAEKGLEFVPAEAAFELPGKTSIALRLERWIHLNEKGWYSADLHVHRDPAEMKDILLAEDLNFAPTITSHVWGESLRTPWPSARQFPVIVDSSRFYTANSQEIERIQGGPGAIVLFGPDVPLPFEGYEFYPPSVRYTREAHARGALVGGDKFFWLDNIVNVALGQIDFIELNSNHILPWGVETDLARWSSWPQEFGYFGKRGLADWQMHLYYHLLNCGFRLPLSAGSASGVKATPVGHNRVYVRAPQPTYQDFMRALKEGRSFTTNGPVIELTVDESHGPGAALQVRPGQKVQVTASVSSRNPIQSVELVGNGRVLLGLPGEGRKNVELAHSLEVAESTWIALRAFEESDRSIVFGHTSPLYLLVENREVRVAESARFLLEKIDRLIGYTEKLEGFREESHRQETIDVYRQARAIYAERLRAGSLRK